MTGPMDATVDKYRQPVLNDDNDLKLVLFGINLRGGVTLSDVPNNVQATWDENRRLAVQADLIGFDAVVPIARWRGWGGDTDLGERSFETFTWATGLLAATQRIQVFATFHVPLAHPVLAAKMCATADHISGGRFGLNVVAGWYAAEMSMFGLEQRDHDDRYKVADEWAQALKQLWTVAGESDYHGEFFDIRGGVMEPKPVQRPYPVIMNAGTSTAGQAFAAKHSDVMFAGLADVATARGRIAAIKERAREQYGREVKVFARGHIVCRDSEREANAYYRYVHNEAADHAAAANVIGLTRRHSERSDWSPEERTDLERVVRGWGLPMVGTPEQVAQQLIDLHRAGADGIALSWVDYDHGLDQMEKQILPLLVEAGVRAPVGVSAATTAR